VGSNLSRRRWLLAAAGMVASGALARQRLLPTPAQMMGPFYPEELPLDQDNDLTRVRGVSGSAEGKVTDLSGRLLDVNGAPIRATRIEIWQCDARGLYHHPRDRDGARDENFQGFGHTVTDADGRYRFRTIRPVPYPGRTPHIHIAVRPDFDEPFITQLYVQGEPRNATDGLFNSIPPERRRLVTANFAPTRSGLVARFDIILGATPLG
jgi:protocatechuate 3,4-dioxygenase beta subunit